MVLEDLVIGYGEGEMKADQEVPEYVEAEEMD
jgi:hypothetical protein